MQSLHWIRILKSATVVSCFVVLLANAGCVQLAANLLHAWHGGVIPAEFDDLKGKRVAVVAITDAGISTDPNSILLANFVRGLLEKNVKKIDLVTQDEVDPWFEGDSTGSEKDFIAMGKGVKADMVVAVEMTQLTLREGQTLFRGKADLAVSVYDMKKSGKVIFRKRHSEFAYPEMGGMPATETDETKFRRVYLLHVAEKLSHHFYGHELGSNVANDATILSY